jgi:hypothetical protein
MAGSLSWRRYTDDRGGNYSFQTDKSSGNAVTNTGFTLSPARSANYGLLPCSLSMRYALAYDRVTPARKRKFWVGNANVFADININVGQFYILTTESNGESLLWLVTSVHGESFKLPRYYGQDDTGLTDGTVSQ